ncbi:MAG: carbohydrate ABC transporter permease [Candidatus Limivivens sp.]|nr:carbohydrate ABC transporter permease [Candidatus Limivivens sp.]
MNSVVSSSTKIKRMILRILLVMLAALMAVPLYIAFVNAFKETKMISKSPFKFPIPPTLANIQKVLNSPNVRLGEMYFNSICIAFFGTVICIAVSALAGYYISRVKNRMSKGLYVYFLFGLMVPYVIVYVPLVTMFKGTGFLGTLPGLILVFVSGSISFSVFMFEGFIRTIPVELEEAALLDGAGQFGIFTRVVMPLIKPCTTTVAIFIGLSMWNDFLTPLLIGQKVTITVGIYTAIGPYASDWGTVFAYVLFATVPIVVVYLLAQEQFISGLTVGAVKG